MAVLSPNEIMFTAFEPHLSMRYIMYMDGVPSYLIKKATFPKYTSNTVVLDHINKKRKIKGKSDWSDMTCTLYDVITPSAAQAVMEWVRLSHESVTGRDGYSDFYKKDIRINQIGPVGDVTKEWILKGAVPKDVDFGEGDWTSDSVVEIPITFSVDYCILNY